MRFHVRPTGHGESKKEKRGTFPLPEGGDRALRPQDIEHPPDIAVQGGPAELGSDLLRPFHQEMTLIPPVLERAKGVLDRFLTLLHDLRVRLVPLLSFFNDVFIQQAGDARPSLLRVHLSFKAH